MPSSAGRPSFKINPKVLQNLRRDKGLTQKELASRVNEKLNRPKGEEATLISSYQRIERTGNTSSARAQALATVLDVTLDVLTGHVAPKRADYVQHITALVRRQLEAGKLNELQATIDLEATQVGEEKALSRIARQIAQQIEHAQLGRNPSDIKDLLSLTGLSEAELLSPANVDGFWFVTVGSSVGPNRSDVFHGFDALSWHLNEIFRDVLEQIAANTSDTSVSLTKDQKWFRIEIRQPRTETAALIDCVYCLPAEKGLLWELPRWPDSYFIEDLLKETAFDTANFVTTFDGQTLPGDLRRLRMLVTEYQRTDSAERQRIVVSGKLNNIRAFTWEGVSREGQSHQLVQSWLTADLRQTLTPFLAAHPVECWSVSSGSTVDILLAPPASIYVNPERVSYRIALVEEIGPNEFVHVPWRNRDREALCQEVKRWIQEPMQPDQTDVPT